MASAVATNLPAAAPPAVPVPVPYGWLSPRVSFSPPDAAAAADLDLDLDLVVVDPVAAMAATPEPAISKDFIDFEFSLGASATMLPADELFADGKLLPLRKSSAALAVPPPADPDPEAAAPQPAQPEEPMPPAPSTEQTVKPLRAAAVVTAAADGTDPYAFSPKAPSCSSRWRELLGLKRAAAAHTPRQTTKASPSPAAAPKTPAARATNCAAARSLKLLLQRNTGRASDLSSAPLLLRDSSDSEASLSLASSRFSLSSSSSSSGHDHDDVPRLSLDSAADPNPPRIRLVRRSSNSHSHSHHRHSTSSTTARAGRSPARRRPSPPRCLSVDSPRMNSSGKVVFQPGLERSSSSPCSFHAAAASKLRSRAAVDRSYSSGVRVAAPVVLNVPVCSRGPVFGSFFKDSRKDSGAAAKDAAAASRSSLGRKAQGWSGELARSSG